MLTTLLWIAIIVATVILDQVTKWLAVVYLKGGDSVSIIGEILHFTYVENRGAAFGMMKDSRWVFMVISVIAIGALIFYLIRFKPTSPLVLISLAMIAGGGIGNMIDRVWLGYVVDFIYIKIIDFAVFNVADSFVCVGTALLALYILFFYKEEKK